MRTHFTTAAKVLAGCLVALALFAGGYVAGQNKFGQPKTIIHMVILKWNPGVSDSDKQAALEGVKKAKLPEDETKRLEKDIQTATDRSIKEINDHLASKEKELLAV